MRFFKYFVLIAIVLQVATSYAQSTIYSITSESEATGYELTIPKEIKVAKTSIENIELTTVKIYDKDLGGFVYITGYVDNNNTAKLKSIRVPSNPQTKNSGCPNGYRACARGCTDKPTESGVLLCTGYCFIDCAFGDDTNE